MNKSLVGAIAGVALLAGCGDDDVSQYTDGGNDDAVSETTAFSFEGTEMYCSHLTESPVRVTCLDVYADLMVKADNRLVSVYTNILKDNGNMQNSEQAADSTEFHYMARSSLCMRDAVVTGVEIVAEDEEGNQGIYTMLEDCARIEEMFGGN